jgi:hypothetical protein
MGARRFAIRYDSAGLPAVLGIGPRSSGVEVDSGEIRVRMGWAFRLDMPLSSVRSVSPDPARVGGTRGVHGGSGRWLVNGSADGLVQLTIEPPGHTHGLANMFVKRKVSSLHLSLVDPDGFIAELAARGVNISSGQDDEGGAEGAAAAKGWSSLSKRDRGLIGVTAVAEVGLLVAALIDIKRRPASQIRGTKRMWRTALAFPNLIVPISYFAFGRRRP